MLGLSFGNSKGINNKKELKAEKIYTYSTSYEKKKN